MDDDGDSEVEMLSISSGDEDTSRVRGAREKGRTGRVEREDDQRWVGGEPECWKHVDETELARWVREMRESRAAPVVQKVERKVSITGKGLHTLQFFPRGMECIDPLGLGIIDNKTLRLITDHADTSPTKAGKDYLDANLRGISSFFSFTLFYFYIVASKSV